MPIIMGTFLGIRKMCNAPVESFQSGGILWFQDLTLADPFYIMPILCAGTIFIMIRVCVFF